jgi:hypothetical protein
MMAQKTKSLNKGNAPSPVVPHWAKSAAPWDEAAKLEIIRYDYRPEGERIDPGVNFFVHRLEALGANPKFSCEGHPGGFYVLFEATYELAMSLEQCGFFTVALASRPHAKDWWRISFNVQPSSEAEKRQTLRWAAEAWQKAFWQ